MKYKTYSIGNRLMALLLCIVMVAGLMPVVSVAAETSQQASDTRITDPSTMDDWRRFFGDGSGDILTEHAGYVWTDKSVLKDASAFAHITKDSDGNDVTITKTDDSFLVALSAMGSNMTVTGKTSVPTDTMLVLDVSGSMNDNDGNNDVAEELVEAANATIHGLLNANPKNRVGVVLYSGTSSSQTNNDAAILMLPLGRYDTGSDDAYLNYVYEEETNWWGQVTSTTETIRLDTDVMYEGTSSKPTAASKEVVGATYIQKGVILAMNQFTANDNETTDGGMNRKPVLVLMSDGAPTLSTTSFTNPGQYNLGNGQASSTNAAQGFVTQLSCAYAKAMIEAKYNTDALFYTVGLGVTSDQVATSVLDPENSNSAIDEFWTRYNAANVDSTVTVQSNNNNARRVTKISTALEQNYVDEYIEVDGSTTDLAQGLIDAFEQIVSSIALQSKYFPTLITDNENISGYISFVDKIGQYMNVTDIKGILIDGKLFSGACLAKNFVAGGGDLGTTENPTTLGDEMVHAVQARLGISDADTARTLIGLAYQYGQLSYTDHNNFSNYIGWYANASGEFLGFWHEGITTMPDPSDPSLSDATRPAFIVKSYGYLGETDAMQGIANSDMMYATVQVRHNIVTGEEQVNFAIPAALLPLVTYNVSLKENGELENLTYAGADNPIRLVYEVALDESINELNLTEKVSAAYLAANTDANGNVSFYSNQYESDNSVGYGKVNTYSYFNPSRQNSKYYFQDNEPIYSDEQGTLYTGTTAPSQYSGELYCAFDVYEFKDGVYRTHTHYRPLADAIKDNARSDGNGGWYVPEQNVHVYMGSYLTYKGGSTTEVPANNATGTLPWASNPYVDTRNHGVDDTGYNYIVGATLGNNGVLTMTPATGIKLTKAMAEGVTADNVNFTFTIQNLTNAADSSTYAAVLELADGSQADTAVQFTGGSATVQLQAGQTLYITGLTNGQQFSITETETADHIVESVNGTDGSNSVTVTITGNRLAQADFVNTQRGKGSLIISKDVNYPDGFAPTDAHNSKVFTLEVTFTGDTTGMTAPSGASLKAGFTNVYTLGLKDGESATFSNIPEGTSYAVEEVGMDQLPGYALQEYRYSDTNAIIGADDIDQVHVVNKYTLEPVSVPLKVQGTKTVTGEWPDNAEFTVRLWQVDAFGSGTITNTNRTNSVTKTDTAYKIDISNIPFTKVGTFHIRIAEDIPAVGDPNRITDMAYDRTLGLFSITITDEIADGKLEVKSVNVQQDTTLTGDAENGWTVTKDFNNVVTTDRVYLDIQKTLTGYTGNNPPVADITFGLFTSMDGNGAPVYYNLTDGNGKTTLMIPVSADALTQAGGKLVYYLREIAPAVEDRVVGMTYNENWLYAFKITWNDETHKANVQWAPINAGSIGTYENYTYDPTAPITHANTYTPGVVSTPEITLSGTKTMTGDTSAIGNRTFQFSVYESTAAFVIPAGSNALQTVTSNGSAITFEPITFDSVGMKYLVIKEEATTHGGVVIDSSEYHVTVLVEKFQNDQGMTALKVADGYPVIVKYGNGAVAKDQINFTNTYTYTDTTYTISGTKYLEGRALLNEEFTFVLTEDANKNGAVDAGERQWTAKNNVDDTFRVGTFTFGAFTYTEPGEYQYLVSEQKNSGSAYGIIYDEHVFTVIVTVTDNGNGALVASAKVDGSSTTPVAFSNRYQAAETSAAIPGSKTLTGKVLGDGDFTFKLYRSNSSWAELSEIPQTNEIKNGTDGSFSFDTITYTTAGTYYYLVKEVNGGQTIAGVTYDDTVFRVRVEVTDDLRGQLHTRTTVFDDNDIPQIGVAFINEYNVTGDARVVLSGTKTLTDRNKALENNEFTFELYSTDSSYSTDGITPVTTTNTGSTYSLTLDYDTDDLGKTFYYVLKEMNAGQRIDGVTHSSVSYKLKVEIQDNGDGTMKPEVECTANGVSVTPQGTLSTVTGLSFTNAYSADPVTYTPTATKTYDGLTMLGFQFTLTGNTGSQVINETKTLDTQTRQVTFTTLEFLSAGDYEFKLVEAKNALWGFIVWDETEYTLKIKVTDNDEGELVINSNDVVVTSTANKSDLSFHNGYDLENGEVTFRVSKSMDDTGDRTDPKGYIFELYENSLSGQPVDTATSDENGKASFQKITYTREDLKDGQGKYQKTATRTYYIREQIPTDAVNNQKDGITYDDKVYAIVVTLTDDEQGHITVSYTVDNADVAENTYEFAFENKYEHAPVDVVIPGTKELVGGGLEPGNFTFALYQTNSTYSIEGLTPISTTTNKANGEFDFNALSVNALHFEDDDTYYFVVTEDSSSPIADTLYDSIVYKLKVVVTDDGKGQLVAALTDSADVAIGSGNPIHFRNVPFDKITEKEVALTSQPQVSVDGRSVEAGDELIYTITYHNYLRYATDVQIVDTIPKHTTFVSADKGGVLTDGVITWSFTNVAPDADIEVTFKVTVDDVNTIFSNEATVRDSKNTYTTNEVYTHTVEDRLVKDVFLSGTTVSTDGKQVEVNDKLTYTITFHNPTDAPAVLDIEDFIPSHTTYVDGTASDGAVFADGKLTWTALNIAPWSSKTVSFQVTVDGANIVLQNQATAWDGTNGYTSNLVNNHTVEDITKKEVALDSKPEVKIDGEKVKVGDVLNYTISYTNITGKDATVTITDKLPQYTSLVSASDDGKLENGTVTWTLDVPAWETYEVVLKVKVEGDKSIYTNTAKVVEGKNEYTTNPVTNHTVDEIVEKDVFLAGNTTVSMDGKDVKVGEQLTYTIDYVNVTGKNATVTITDKLPAGTTFVSASNGGKHENGTVTWTLAVDPWQTASVTVTVKVTAVSAEANNQAVVVEGNNEHKTNVVTNELYQIMDMMVEIQAVKTVKNIGSGNMGPEGFSFVLENTATGEKLTAKSDKDGLVVYGLTFTQQDIGKTYSYKLSEVNTGIAGVTYDTAVYTYTVTVGVDDAHKLTSQLTANGAAALKLDASFTNIYAGAPTTPQTGDHMPLGMMVALLVISGAAIMALIVIGKKKHA